MIGKILGLSKEQMNAARYAIKMRREGYTLLKNPKGAPNTEVNLIDIKHGVTIDDFHDHRTVIDRIKTTFENGQKYVESRLVTSTRFRDADTKELGKKRNIDLYAYNSKTKSETVKVREDLSKEELKHRKKPNWQKGFLYDEYGSEYMHKETFGNPARNPYFTQPGEKIIVPILTFGMIKPKGPTRPNFFKVLWDNLHNNAK